jgi:hypothetical protein
MKKNERKYVLQLEKMYFIYLFLNCSFGFVFQK